MKIRKINFIKIWIVLLGLSLFLSNCDTNQEYLVLEQSQEQVKRNINSISFNELPSNLIENVNSLNQTFSKRSENSETPFIIEYSQIIEYVNSSSETKYSIKFSIENQQNNVLYNLVLGNDEQGQETIPYVMKYTIDNIEEISQNGYFDFGKMRGEISKYNFNDFLNYYNNQSNRLSNRNPDPSLLVPCETVSNTDDNGTSGNNGGSTGSSGSGTSGSPSGGSPSGGGGGGGSIVDPYIYLPVFYQTSTTIDCTVYTWSNGETGEVFAVSWSCSDGNSGYIDIENSNNATANRTESDNCNNRDEIGINDGSVNWPYTNCASFEYANVNGIKGAHTIGVNDTFVTTQMTSPSTSELRIENIYYPSLFFTMPSHWTNGRAATLTARALDNAIDNTKSWFIENPSASTVLLEQTWFNFIKAEMNAYGGNVRYTPLFSVPSPSPYSTSWFPSNCG